MDFNATIDLIIKDLDEARTIIDDLKKYPGVPVLQVELAKSKCKSAGEVIALLKTLQEKTEPVQKTEIRSETKQEEPQLKSTESQTEILETEPESQQEIPHIKSVKPEHTVKEKTTSGPVDELIRAAEKATESSIIADRFVHLASSINEQLGTHKDDDLSGLHMAKPVSSLSEAIGINDRFLFVREIFNGDREAYNQAIAKLENAETIIDAKAVLMSYTGNSTDNDATKQLLELFKRKLPNNG
jgi:hypothetical protein